MWRTYKEAGRPIPRFSDDDFIDYCILEALHLRVLKEENKDRKAAERKQQLKEAKERLVRQHG